jgi:hypothetical protein
MKSSRITRFTFAVVLSTLGTASWWEAACAGANATPETTASAESQIQGMGAQAPAAPVTSPVTINGRPLSAVQVRQLQAAYGVIFPGRYWYDPISGYWGLEGRDPAGYTQTGLNFGPVSPRASNGHSGAFLNGREISFGEQLIYSRIFGTAPTPGRFWLDGRTGNVGLEGFPYALDNIVARIQQARGGSSGFARGDMVGITNGNCTMVTTSSGYNASTSGC